MKCLLVITGKDMGISELKGPDTIKLNLGEIWDEKLTFMKKIWNFVRFSSKISLFYNIWDKSGANLAPLCYNS